MQNMIRQHFRLLALVLLTKWNEEYGFTMKGFKFNKTGFTYIEMLVVIALVALCFVPLLQMFVRSLEEVGQYSELGTATQVGREVLERLKNLRLVEAQIERAGTVWFPPQSDPPLIVNQKDWRVKQTPIPGTDPLEIHVEVFRAKDLKKPLLELSTLIEDL